MSDMDIVKPDVVTYQKHQKQLFESMYIRRILSKAFESLLNSNAKSENAISLIDVNVVENALKSVINEHQAVMLAQVIALMKLTISLSESNAFDRIQVIEYENLYEICEQYRVNAVMFDENYTIMPADVASVILSSDFIKYAIYVKDLFDCDDYADTIKTIIDEMLLINSIGFAIGKIVNPENNELIGYHAFNVVPVYDDEKKNYELWIYEPQLGEWTNITKPVIANVKYEIDCVLFG